MGILCIDGELILTLLLFHSHIDNVKMSLKVDCTELRDRHCGGVGFLHLKFLTTSAEKWDKTLKK